MSTERQLHSLAELLAWTAGKVVKDDWDKYTMFTDGSRLRVVGTYDPDVGAEVEYWVTDAPGAPPAADPTTDPITGVDLPPAPTPSVAGDAFVPCDHLGTLELPADHGPPHCTRCGKHWPSVPAVPMPVYLARMPAPAPQPAPDDAAGAIEAVRSVARQLRVGAGPEPVARHSLLLTAPILAEELERAANALAGAARTPSRAREAVEDAVSRLSPAPCDRCGYNGVGYYQPTTHPCAALRPARDDSTENASTERTD